ncbi:MAG: PAS domain S-box protein [Thermomicrobiales bacterium]
MASIVEAAQDGILSVTQGGMIATWNEGATRIYGYSAEEAIGQPVSMLRPPESASEIRAMVAPVWDGAVFSRFETERITKDGRRIPVSLSVFPIRDADGNIVAVSSITHDLSLQRQAEAEQRLRNRAMDAARKGIVIIDPTLPGQPVVDINPAFTRLTGYTRDEVLGRNCHFLQGPDTDPGVARQLGEAIAQGRDATVTLLNYRRDGTPFWNNLSLAAVHDATGALTHYVGIFNDITDRIRLEQDLREALAAAEAGNASKTRFLAMMSHELRTPLQSIIGYADMLLEPRSGYLSQQQREDVQAISKGAYRMVNLIEQLLDVARMQFGPLPVRHERVDLKPIIDMVMRAFGPEATSKGLQVSCDVPAATPAVRGDAGRISQVLSSLVGNAVKFTLAGGIQLAVRPAAGMVAIEVRDTGIGIAADRLPHIFEAFRQGHIGLNRPYEGAGVGLTIAEQLVRQMHGDLTVQSTPGEGTTFTVWLPVAES